MKHFLFLLIFGVTTLQLNGMEVPAPDTDKVEKPVPNFGKMSADDPLLNDVVQKMKFGLCGEKCSGCCDSEEEGWSSFQQHSHSVLCLFMNACHNIIYKKIGINLIKDDYITSDLCDTEGRTPFHMTCLFGWQEAAESIIQHWKINVDELMERGDSEGNLPLDYAMRNRSSMHPEVPNLPFIAWLLSLRKKLFCKKIMIESDFN